MRRAVLFVAIGAIALCAAQTVQAQHAGRVVFDGNSLVAGACASPGHAFPDVVWRSCGRAFHLRNVAVNGQTTPMMTADAAAQIDPMYRPTWAFNVVVPWEIRNDLIANALTPADAIARYVAYCQARRWAGFLVLAMTMLPTSAYDKTPTYDADRAVINGYLRQHWRSFADGLADVAADRRIGGRDDAQDLTFYAGDGAHLNDRGYRVVAGVVKRSLLSLLARHGCRLRAH